MVLTSLRRVGIAGALAAMVAPGIALAAAAGAVPATRAVGTWDLKLEDGSRQCRIMLRSDILDSGYAVGMPMGCHHAFPMLSTVAIWIETGEGQIQLADTAGQPLLIMAPAADGVMTGTGPEGNLFRLEPVGPHKAVVLKLAAKARAPAAAEPTVAAAPAQRRPVVTPAEVAGHYAVMRDKTRDTGCMVTLDAKAHGPKGTLKANLAPACRDQGIMIFDPVGWEMIGGRLVLMARKGHTTKLDMQDDGTWLKDPKDGKSLGLKRL